MGDAAPDLDFVDDWLAIGARIDASHGASLARGHRIARVVDLREEAPPDGPDLSPWGIERLHLPTLDMAAPTPAQLDRGVAWALDGRSRGARVLVHCEHGVGRSALLACCCLVALGASPDAALSRAKDRRARVAPSPVQLEALVDWSVAYAARHGRALAAPSWEALATIAYRHLADS